MRKDDLHVDHPEQNVVTHSLTQLFVRARGLLLRHPAIVRSASRGRGGEVNPGERSLGAVIELRYFCTENREQIRFVVFNIVLGEISWIVCWPHSQ